MRLLHFLSSSLDIDEEFQEQLRIFVSHILDSNNIVVKHINGQPLTYRELVLLIKDYIAILNNVDLFKTESLITVSYEQNKMRGKI